MILDPDSFAALVSEANLAPSVHNTQPTRWRLGPDGGVSVLEAADRRLAIGDPLGRDADVSHGAAIEGFALAASARGWTVEVTPSGDPAGEPVRKVARLVLAPGGEADDLQTYVSRRQSFRGQFGRVSPSGDDPHRISLDAAEDVRLATTAGEIARLAHLNDRASLGAYRNKAFRAELVSWMRFSRRDPRWPLDGLNAESLSLSSFEAAGANMVLKSGVFETLDRLGVASVLVAESKVVRSARAIALFHRPKDEPPLLTGRRFYRLWLELTRLGLSAAPMSVLADDPETRAIIADEFRLPSDRRLITTFRLGVGPVAGPARARLPSDQLIS
jgi:hypothetical protein